MNTENMWDYKYNPKWLCIKSSYCLTIYRESVVFCQWNLSLDFMLLYLETSLWMSLWPSILLTISLFFVCLVANFTPLFLSFVNTNVSQCLIALSKEAQYASRPNAVNLESLNNWPSSRSQIFSIFSVPICGLALPAISKLLSNFLWCPFQCKGAKAQRIVG